METDTNKEIDIDKVAYALSLTEREIIPKDVCSNEFCGYKGDFIKERNGSLLLMIFLFFYGLLPGIFYWAEHRGYSYFCPKCGRRIRKR